MAWSGSPIAVSPAPSPVSARSRSYCTGSMSWYSSTLTNGHRARSPAAIPGSPASSAADSSASPSKSTRPRAISSPRSAGRPSGSSASLRPSRSDPVSSAATRTSAASSATPNEGGSPAASGCSPRIRRPRPWNVVTVSSSAGPASTWPRPASRSRISWAARRVNVMARNCRAGRPSSVTWWAIRWVSVRVLPVPGPAMISSGPAAVAAARWSGSRPSSTEPVPGDAGNVAAPPRRARGAGAAGDSRGRSAELFGG